MQTNALNDFRKFRDKRRFSDNRLIKGLKLCCLGSLKVWREQICAFRNTQLLRKYSRLWNHMPLFGIELWWKKNKVSKKKSESEMNVIIASVRVFW